MQQSLTACVSSVKENRNIKTYFLGSILSAAKCSVDNYNISKTSNVQNQLWRRVTLTTRNLFLYNKIDFLIRLRKIVLLDFYHGLSEHLMGVWSSLNNKMQSINDKCENQYILSTWFNGCFLQGCWETAKNVQVLSVLKGEST